MRSLIFPLLLLAGCHSKAKQEIPPVPVTAVRVDPQDIPAEFSYVGVGESSHIVQLRARVEGYLEAICYKEGALVQKDDLMFVLDERPFIAAVGEAQGQLDRQQAILWNAEQTKARMVPLYEQNAVSQRDLDNALAEELAAKADVETAASNLYKAQLNLGFASISSPVTGLSSQAKYREGALIDPQENLLTTIYVVDPIWVNFCVSDLDLLQAHKDVSEGFLKWPKEKGFHIEAILSDGTVIPSSGTIDFTNPAIQQSTGTMLIRSVFPNPKVLIYPGQFVRVVVKGATYPQAVAIPQTAVVQGGRGTFVYVVENGKAVERAIEPGPWVKESYWIIRKGLKAGDIVITQGVNKVHNGSAVSIQSLIPSQLPK